MIRTISITAIIVNAIASILLFVFGHTIMEFAPSFAQSPLFAPSDLYLLYAGVVLYVPFVVHLLAVLVGIVAALIYVSRRNSGGAAQGTTPSKFGLWYLYSMGGVWVCILLLHVFVVYSAGVRVSTDLFLMATTTACVQAGLLVATILIGGLLASVVSLWRTNKVVSIILAVIIACILGLVLAASVGVYVLSNESASYYTGDTNDEEYGEAQAGDADIAYPEEEEYEEEYPSGMPEGQDEDYEYQKDVFMTLAGNPDYSQELEQVGLFFIKDCAFNPSAQWSVYNSVSGSYFKDSELIDYSFSKTADVLSQEEFKEAQHRYRLMYLYARTDPTSFLHAFEQHQALMLRLVPKDVYRNSRYSVTVELLLQAYNDIYLRNNSNAVLDAIYTEMERTSSSGEELWIEEHYSTLKPYMGNNPTLDKALRQASNMSDNNTVDYESMLVWSYSFWARRHREGNDAMAHAVLRKIQKMYE